MRCYLLCFLLTAGLTACQWYHQLPRGEWTKIHEQHPGDTVVFSRQSHGGSAFDTKRGRIILFGSDTHGENWYNSPFVFDTRKRRWSQLYPHDPVHQYRVNESGIPVAGEDHPWAMHTFAALAYHRKKDQLVVSSYPKHMSPGRFSRALDHLWPRVKQHPSWILSLAKNKWHALPAPAVHFFPFTTSYDPINGRILGYRSDGIYALSGTPLRWSRIADQGMLGYHNNSVFDLRHGSLVVLGSHENSNDVVIYRVKTGEHKIMPTPGLRPPKGQHIPMAYHENRQQVVALFAEENTGVTRTWLYDLEFDRWQLDKSRINFPVGMNYNLEYDNVHDVLLLVTAEPGKPVSVWALRL